jgi:hypothetical protein
LTCAIARQVAAKCSISHHGVPHDVGPDLIKISITLAFEFYIRRSTKGRFGLLAITDTTENLAMFTLNRKLIPGLVLATNLLAAGNALAADRVAIPFAELGNIKGWHAENSEELYVENLHGQWFRITFWSPCNQLPFAIGIAFVTDSIGSLDKYSSILVNGESCWFRTFEKSAEPLSADETNTEGKQ